MEIFSIRELSPDKYFIPGSVNLIPGELNENIYPFTQDPSHLCSYAFGVMFAQS
jgi:hypothetical protein